MQTVTLLNFCLTILSLCAALIAVYSERKADRHADAAQDRTKALATALARNVELIEEQAAIKRRLDRLAGRFYREKQNVPAEPETADQTRARLRAEHGMPKLGPIAGNSGE